jgi:TonB family protein
MATGQSADPFLIHSNDGIRDLLRYFGFREQPFGVTPNPAFLFSSRVHRVALHSMVGAIESNRGFTLLLGDPGMGKTTLLFQLLTQYRESARTGFIFQTQCKRPELLRHLVAELELPVEKWDEVSLHQTLKEMLVNEAAAGRKVLVIIDEAQNLQASSLEAIRLLSDFETPTAKLLHIVLAGSNRLSDTLASADLSQLAQRISTVCRLYPLSPEEIEPYVTFRLAVAGRTTPDSLFLPEALAEIAEQSRGIPRVVNSICYGALSLAYTHRARQVGGTLVRQAAQNLDLSLPRIQESELAGTNYSQRTTPQYVPPLRHLPNYSGVRSAANLNEQIRQEAAQTSYGQVIPSRMSGPVQNGSLDQAPAFHWQNNATIAGQNQTAQPQGVSHSPDQHAGIPRFAALKSDRVTMAIAIVGIIALILGASWYELNSRSAGSRQTLVQGKPVIISPINTFDSPMTPIEDGQPKTQTRITETAHTSPKAVGDAKQAQSGSVERNVASSRAPVVVPLPQSVLPSKLKKRPDGAAEAEPLTYTDASGTPLPRALFAGSTLSPNVSLRLMPETHAISQRPLGKPIVVVKPEYPRDAQLRHVQGDVLLELQVDPEGNVQNARRVKGDALLGEAAERAARQWRYRASTDDQDSALAVTWVWFKFTLKGEAEK